MEEGVQGIYFAISANGYSENTLLPINVGLVIETVFQSVLNLLARALQSHVFILRLLVCMLFSQTLILSIYPAYIIHLVA